MVNHPKTFGRRATLSDVAAFFLDDHVHMALVVADDRRLITAIERGDLSPSAAASTPATALGTLEGRTVSAECPLGEATAAMLHAGRRRLAVVDQYGGLLGLLCLKRSHEGFCSDEGIASRAAERARRCSDDAQTSDLQEGILVSELDEYLTAKRAKINAFREAALADPQAIEFAASVEVRGRTGVRVIRIRQFEMISDTERDLGGFDLGANSPEYMLAALGGCIAHSAEMVAAGMALSVDAISVDVAATMHPLAQRLGYEHVPFTPHNLKYTLRIESSEPADRIEALHKELEASCPVLNLIRAPQQISGQLEHLSS
jgi:uncharacterized OsmC-like protein